MATPLVLPNSTLLVLTPLSGAEAPQVTPYSARGLTQTYEMVSGDPNVVLRRDVNGFLRDVSDERLRKFNSTITCTDGETPCVDSAWVGTSVQVECTFELSYVTGATPARPAVPGSVRTEGTITFYRPELQMMIAAIKNSFAEYPSTNAWSIDLKEI
jgi:hypothetical protein